MSTPRGPRRWARGKIRDRSWMPFTVWMKDMTHAELKLAAFERKVSMQALVQLIIEAYLEFARKSRVVK